MPPWWRRARRGFYHLVAVVLAGVVAALPARAGSAACRALARGALRLLPRQRRRAQSNLARAFPERDQRSRAALLSAAAAALGDNLYDAVTLPRLAARGFDRVEDDGAVAALRALQGEGRGVLVLTGHLGCWELLGAYLAARLGSLAVVTGSIHNPPVDRWVNRRRRRLGMVPLPREGDLRPLLRTLRRGGAAAVLLDQRTRVDSLDVPFFGRAAPTATGFARLALRTGAPVLPVAIGRRGAGHVVRHLPPLRPAGGADPAAVYSFLRECNAALERLIRDNPVEWVWFHARWRDEGPAGEET